MTPEQDVASFTWPTLTPPVATACHHRLANDADGLPCTLPGGHPHGHSYAASAGLNTKTTEAEQ